MSLETFLKPLLYNKSEDMEWYVKATHSALNSYMLELHYLNLISKFLVLQ